MTYNQLRRMFGPTEAQIAKRLNVSRQLVAYWRRHGISKPRQAWLREQISKQ